MFINILLACHPITMDGTIIIYEVLLMLRESLLALSQLSTPTSSLFTVAWCIVNVTVRCKNCCSICKMNKMHLIWGHINVIDMQKKEYWAQHQPLWNTHVMLDMEELQFLIETYCFLLGKYYSNQRCMTPLMSLCRSVLINMLWTYD